MMNDKSVPEEQKPLSREQIEEMRRWPHVAAHRIMDDTGTDAFDALCGLALSALDQPDKGQWIAVSERLPKTGVPVIAFYKNALGKGRRIRAFYTPAKTIEDDNEDEAAEHDEATDNYYLREGWYENNEHDEVNWLVDEPVTDWMLLPPPPGQDKPAATPSKPNQQNAAVEGEKEGWVAVIDPPKFYVCTHNGMRELPPGIQEELSWLTLQAHQRVTKETVAALRCHLAANAALVPREPTDEWAERFCAAVNWMPDGSESKLVEGQWHHVTFRELAKGYIKAMLAASPSLPQSDTPEGKA